MTVPNLQVLPPRFAPSVTKKVGADVTIARDLQVCPTCKIPTRIRVGGNPGHYVCLTPVQATGDDPIEEREVKGAFQLLEESIRASRKHPLLRVPRADRELPPWTIITETMRGEHRWRRRDVPGGTMVTVLDRNGSYPSAMGNVAVAANKLVHTGPLADLNPRGSAGIFQIPAFDWLEPGPHPLGEIADDPLADDRWWISTPHLALLRRLVRDGRIPQFGILDSWTGASVTNLFKQFSADMADARARAATHPAGYRDLKRQSSIAIRCLWPKGEGVRSPFWRPDWSVAVRAEAAVRHWARADQAVHNGAQLVRLGAVDEAAYVRPADAKRGWVPSCYTLGTHFGQVKIKDTVRAEVWNAGR